MTLLRTDRIRWWPAMLLLAVAAAALAFVWLEPNRPRQARNLRSAMILLSSAALLLAWLLTISRARWRTRLTITAAAFVSAGTMAALFEIRGVTGDLVPLLELRWKPRHSLRVEQGSEQMSNQWQRVPGRFPGLYGERRDSVVSGVILETNWTVHSPQVIWKQPVGAAWSGFAVQDGLAVTQEQREDQETVACYEVLTGRLIWSHSDTARYGTTIAGEGPRATPTIASNLVFTFGATGLLNCLELETGLRRWQRDTARENDASIPDWGLASSPLVVDDIVAVSVGGKNGRSLCAYAIDTGVIRWTAGNAGADYSSPVLTELGGTRQIVIFNAFGVEAYSLGGQRLWGYPWPGGHPHITPPLTISGNHLLASSGYGTGAELLAIKLENGDWAASRLWKSLALKSKFGPLFRAGDFVYGLDDGMMACIDLKAGKRQWKDGRYGHGQGLLVGTVILLTSERGELVLIDPTPAGLVELHRFPLFSDKTWNPPALAGEYLLVRNHKEAACIKLAVSNRSRLALNRNFK